MALPNRRAFDFPSRRLPSVQYGVQMLIVPGDHNALVEIERAPDSGGSPGTYVALTAVRVPKSGMFFTDVLPNDNATRWYRARHATSGIYGSAGSYFTAFSAVPRILRDDVMFTQGAASTPFTRTEDILTAAITEPKVGTGAITELKIGTDAVTTAKIDDSAVTTPKVSQDSCKVSRVSSDQTIAHNTITNVAFDGEVYDAANMFDAGSDATLITVPRAGKVIVIGEVGFKSGGGTYRYADLVVGGSVIAGAQHAPASGVITQMNLSGVANVSASDSIRMRVLQDSGGNLDISALKISLAVHYVTG